jgi:hypothetical protein
MCRNGWQTLAELLVSIVYRNGVQELCHPRVFLGYVHHDPERCQQKVLLANVGVLLSYDREQVLRFGIAWDKLEIVI